MTTKVRQEVAEAAREHLAELTSPGDRVMNAWAVGVLSAGHCLHLVSLMRGGDPAAALGHEHSGGLVDGLRCLFTRRGAEAKSRAGVRVTVTWREVAAVVEPALARPGVREALDAAMRKRYDLTGCGGEAWGAVEDECYQLAAQVWVACRPAAQLDLFEVAP